MMINAIKLVLLLLPILQCQVQKKLEKSEYQNGPVNKKVLSSPNDPQQNVLQYPLGVVSLIPEYQDGKLGLYNEKQTFPRIQPQFLFYPGGLAPGQQFLLQPASPPNNFLIPQPQPGPEVILRDTPQFLTPAGFPRPSHIPPIERDAEEIPTDQVGVHHPAPKSKGNKPEKLENFDVETEKTPTEAEVLAEADKDQNKPTASNLKPGQRFFFLNGQTLFPSFPHDGLNDQRNHFFNPFHFFEQSPQQNPGISEKQNGVDNQKGVPFFNQDSLQNFQRNPVTGQITDVKDFDQKNQKPFLITPENSVVLNQPLTANNQFFADFFHPFPVAKIQSPENNENKQAEKDEGRTGKQTAFPLNTNQFNLASGGYNLFSPDLEHVFGNGIFGQLYDLGPLQQKSQDNNSQEGVTIDSNQQNQKNSSDAAAAASPNTPADGNPTISQAQPAGVAVAGKGGIASSGSKGTALAGKRGTAVSSPVATAIAGIQETKTKTSETKS